jgi:hypothetical protein
MDRWRKEGMGGWLRVGGFEGEIDLGMYGCRD